MAITQVYLNDTFTTVRCVAEITLTTTLDIVVPTSAASNQSALIAAITPRAVSTCIEEAKVALVTQDLSSQVTVTVAPAATSDVNPSVTTN